ncbi:retrovirus-related Pol polyprotein from transposon opus [Trichonephila clavipes]|uniref:Retrovirus-related Pol polyprotein from transposon opus n=1 Tax=Trichonephila clavipes TaxID=2585209 RepID=A0A8X6S567_TRICX|nr:retrovirus-related Pol polyprotein from transposon opus [Trichonephila clavipes]
MEKPFEIDLSDTKLGEGQKQKLRNLFHGFKGLFSDQPGLTHVLYHEIDTGDKGPVVSRPYRYDRVKHGIIDYYNEKMLQEGTIRPIQSPYAFPVVFTLKNNGLPPDSPVAYRFAIDYRKHNAKTKYPRYPLPVIDDLITITGVMSTVDLKSGYFQLAISPKDIEKTAIITRNGTFAFLRMPFVLSGAAPNFQKDSFDKIQRALTEAPALQLPNFTEQFNIFTDANGVGIGTVLNQNHRPFAFASRTLNKAERNYTVIERECLVVIWALNKFKTYFGSLPVKVITDHAALTKLTHGKNLSSRMIRWALKLSEFNIEWEHRPGVQTVVAVVLSRNPVGNLDGSQISCAALRALTLKSREQLIREQRDDPELRHIYRYLENPDDGSVKRLYARVEGAEYVGRNIEKLFDEARQNMRKQHKNWGKYYNRKRREVNIKVNDLVLVQTHFISSAGRRVVGKFMPKFEEPYRVLEVRNNNLITWKKGKSVTVNVDQISSNRSSRSQPGKFKGSRKTSSEESNGRKSNKGNAGWEDPRLKRKGSEHRDQKRPTPEPKQGIKRAIPSSVPSRNYKYRRPNNPSQGSQSIAGPSYLRNARQGMPPTEGSKHDMTGQYDKAWETRTTTSGTNRAAERRPVRSKQATAVRPCPYYLLRHVKQPKGVPKDRRSIGIESIPQNKIRRRSLSMEALDGDPVDRSE